MRRENSRGGDSRGSSGGNRNRGRDGEGGAGGDRAASAARRPFFRRRKTCPFTGPNAPKIDWKDVRTLSRQLSERGKIMPSRISAVSAPKQRELAQAVKRARFMALLPYAREAAGDYA